MYETLQDSGLSGCSLQNIRNDLRTMDDWLPSIVKGEIKEEDVERVVTNMRAKLQLAQERLSRVMYTGDSSSAQVGAADKFMKAINMELDVLTRAGLIKPAQIEVKQEVKGDVITWDPAEIFAEFGETILGDALRRRLQADRGSPEEDLPESLDPEDE